MLWKLNKNSIRHNNKVQREIVSLAITIFSDKNSTEVYNLHEIKNESFFLKKENKIQTSLKRDKQIIFKKIEISEI